MISRELIFQATESPWWFALTLVMLATAIALIVTLIRYERRLVPPAVGRSLLLLRLAVLLLLGLALAEPVISWSRDRTRTGRILVAIDLSDSMDMTDRHASRADKLRWARALDMVGNPAIDRRLDGWIEALEAGREPAWVDADETVNPERREQLAGIRRQNLDEILKELDTITRKQIARRLLVSTGRPLLDRIAETGPLELRLFAGGIETVDREGFEAAVDEPPERIRRRETDLSGPLRLTGGEESSPLAAVVILTDGRQTGGGDAVTAASQLGIPVFGILLGSTDSPRDLVVSAVDSPRTVFLQDKPRVTVSIRTSGFAGQAVEVVLEPDGDPDQAITRTFQATGNVDEVAFELDADKLGRRRYVVRAVPQPNELNDDNNQRSFGLNVVDDTANVVLIDGEARWEFRFIDNALSRDDRADVERVVFDQPFLGLRARPFFPTRIDIPTADDALEQSIFAEADLVIVGDVPPDRMTEPAWTLLEEFVGEAGGTLVMVAGKNHLPRAFRSETLARLLPVEQLRPLDVRGNSGRGAPTSRGFRVTLTPDGSREPMLQFHIDQDENRQIWNGLPGHLWGLIGTARPGATVWAHARLIDQDDGERMPLERERTSALFVHQYFGLGQVVWIGLDSTWRWRYRVGDTYHHRFWGQLARWAARNKAVTRNEFVRFGVQATELDANTAAVIHARWRQTYLARHPGLEARAEIRAADDPPGSPPVAVVPLVAVEGQPLLWSGRHAGLPPGEYLVQLEVNTPDLDTSNLSAQLFVHQGQTAELTDLTADRELLERIAQATGGRLVRPGEVADLPDEIERTTRDAALFGDVLLWDHWTVLAIFFVLMTVEWVIRKVNGLP